MKQFQGSLTSVSEYFRRRSSFSLRIVINDVLLRKSVS